MRERERERERDGGPPFTNVVHIQLNTNKLVLLLTLSSPLLPVHLTLPRTALTLLLPVKPLAWQALPYIIWHPQKKNPRSRSAIPAFSLFPKERERKRLSSLLHSIALHSDHNAIVVASVLVVASALNIQHTFMYVCQKRPKSNQKRPKIAKET